MARTTTRPARELRRLPAGWAAFYRVVRRVPRGRVTTYGAVAALAGRPGGARHVGFALAALPGTRHGVPWQRVAAARGRGFAAVTIRDPVGAAVQRRLLEAEGVRFDARGRVDLAAFGWGLPTPAKRDRAREPHGAGGGRAASGRRRGAR